MHLISCCAKTGFANTYVVGPDAGNEAALIDPGHFPAGLLSRIERAGMEVAAVLLTHGHRAHSGGLDTVLSVYRTPVYATPQPAFSARVSMSGTVTRSWWGRARSK